MPGQDLGLPGPNGASKPRQLLHLDAVYPAVEVAQRGPGVAQVAGGVAQVAGGIDRAEQLFALPGRGQVAGRIPGGKAGPQPCSSPAGELLGRGQQQLADVPNSVGAGYGSVWVAGADADSALRLQPAEPG